MKGLDQLNRAVADNIVGEQERQARYYDAKHREPFFQTGDYVWKRNRILSCAAQGVSAKLAPKFAGPYAIIVKTGINTYRIRALEANDEELIHAEHLKPYVGARPSDDEQEEGPRPPRENAAIVAISDPPVASDGENDEHVEHGNFGVAIDPDRAPFTNPANLAVNSRTPSPLPVRRPGRPRKAVRLV